MKFFNWLTELIISIIVILLSILFIAVSGSFLIGLFVLIFVICIPFAAIAIVASLILSGAPVIIAFIKACAKPILVGLIVGLLIGLVILR